MLKQKFDEMIVALAAAFVPIDVAAAIGAVVSVNVLTASSPPFTPCRSGSGATPGDAVAIGQSSQTVVIGDAPGYFIFA